MTRVLLNLGSNLGDKIACLAKAREEINKYGQIIAVSALYESEAWGGIAQDFFINQSVLLDYQGSAFDLLEICLGIEKNLGRERRVKWGERTIDIDIIYFGSDIIATRFLRVPHPHAHERAFVLLPTAEILPDFKHPVFEKEQSELLAICPDKLRVQKIET